MTYKPNLRQPYPNELYHFGILGQKWGIRRFQNADGSYTAAGKKRYSGETGTKGLFSKKKKKTEPEKKTLGISEEEKAFTETVKKAGFRQDYAYDISGNRVVVFEKTIPNSKTKINIDYRDGEESNPNNAVRKAERFSKDSNKILSKSINNLLNESYNEMRRMYEEHWDGLGPAPKLTKRDFKDHIFPEIIDARRNSVMFYPDFGGGVYEVRFDKNTYEPYKVRYSD